MDEEEDWEDLHRRREKQTNALVSQFVKVMAGEKRKGKKKVLTAADMVSFFSLEYLSAYEGEGLLEGLESFPSFVGDWFLRKCMWSDEKSVKANIEAFLLFLEYLELSETITKERAERLRKVVEEGKELWCARAWISGHLEYEFEDFRDDWGGWKDEDILGFYAAEHGIKNSPASSSKAYLSSPSADGLALNVLFSARVAKFLGLKPTELQPLTEWGEWGGAEHHWSSYWRCEDAFGITKSKKRVLLITNQRTHLSFVVIATKGDMQAVLKTLFEKMMSVFKKENVSTPSEVQISFNLMKGAARSLTGFMNGQLAMLSHYCERQESNTVEDWEDRLNISVALKLPETFPNKSFAKMCKDDPPFGGDAGKENIIPFMN